MSLLPKLGDLMKLQLLWLQRIPPTFLAMAARNDLCLCCGLATKQDRRLLCSKSCESVLPALLHLIEQVMFESRAESPTSEITECTPCLYLHKEVLWFATEVLQP